MISKKYVLVVFAVSLVGVQMYAKRYRQNQPEQDQPHCMSKIDCKKNQDCQCYCSEKGDFRKKTPGDKPVWKENDPRGIYCYCKQWDFDKYPGPAKRD